MKTLHFQIDYRTADGGHVELAYSVDGGPCAVAVMQAVTDSLWQVFVAVPDDVRHIRHAYRVVAGNGDVVRVERNSWRLFRFNHRTDVFFCDAWADHALPYWFHRSAFAQNVMLPRHAEALHLEEPSASCMLLLCACPPTDGRRWAVVGDAPDWGEWDVSKARMMRRAGTYEWVLPIARADFDRQVQYKYLLVDPVDARKVEWEEGGNRRLYAAGVSDRASLVRQDEMPVTRMPAWHGAGCVVPVFSLRSEGSLGIGDFGDLRVFVRWAAEAGMCAVQLLPVNDTTRTGGWRDSYPYNGISVFALHPIYIDAREWKRSQAYESVREEGRCLNALPQLDYEKSFALKLRFLHLLFVEIGRTVLKSRGYRQFISRCAGWLDDYARFCVLRDHYGTANFRSWPQNVQDAADLPPAMAKGADFYKFVQYLLHCQMERVHEQARALGVILKGDIPIGVSPDSVPAWVDGRLFHFDGQAGAPPDDFAIHGQNWGFPTYNWEEMAKDGYAWWRRRLGHMAHYFDAYRIDHVLGFFRIWEVPACQIDGVLGHFRPALPLSADDIRSWGFGGDVRRFVRPWISDRRLAVLQETYGTEVKERFFAEADGGYTLRPEYGTQRSIAALHLKDQNLERSLLDVAGEVLFVEDPDRPAFYHPRVCAQRTGVFARLDEGDRSAFNRLYDDFFYVRHNAYWAEEAMKKLPVVTQSYDTLSPSLRFCPLEGAGMLPCAEDLGMVPASVKGVLERLEILSLEIQRMPKEYGVRFADLRHNPYMSVATIATHDMPPLRLWWREDRERTQAFWRDVLRREGPAPEDASPEVCEEVVTRHVQSPSMLCLLALQDWLAVSPTLRSRDVADEQINVPSNPHQYWRYRMHITLEQLIRATGFSEKIRGIIFRS